MADETGSTPAKNTPARAAGQQQSGTKPPGEPGKGGGDQTAGSPARAAGQQPASSADGANEGAFDNPADATPESS